MKRIFYPLITAFIFFGSIHALAYGIDNFDIKNYVYDDEGNPVFIKVYTTHPKTRFSDLDQNHSPTQQNNLQHLLNQLSQNDCRGSYVVIPIKKKKSQEDDDKDESNWECPYCGRINKSSENRCGTKGCVLH